MKLLTLMLGLLIFSPSAQKQANDREDEGLKGNVKEVVSEDAGLSVESGREVEGKRVLSSKKTFDSGRSLVRQVFYNNAGKVDFIIVYAEVDGDKTSTITYADDPAYPPPPAPLTKQTTVSSGVADPRYDSKYKYKFDASGNRIEETRFNNRGLISIRDVRKFDAAGNRIGWARYTANGELNMSSSSTFDAQGREVEETYYNGDGTVSEKYSYSDYVFDSHGNWIKRRTSKWVTKGGKSAFVPTKVTYREISYF